MAKPFLQAREDYTVKLEDLHWAQFRGSLVHGSMENFREHELSKGFIIEEELRAELDGVTLRGRIDNYDKTKEILFDWKTTKAIYPKYLPKKDNIIQMHGYMFLLAQNNYEVKRCILFYMDASETYRCEIRVPPMDEIITSIRPYVQRLSTAFVSNECPTPEPSALCDGSARGGKIFCSVKKFCPHYQQEYRGKKYGP